MAAEPRPRPARASRHARGTPRTRCGAAHWPPRRAAGDPPAAHLRPAHPGQWRRMGTWPRASARRRTVTLHGSDFSRRRAASDRRTPRRAGRPARDRHDTSASSFSHSARCCRDVAVTPANGRSTGAARASSRYHGPGRRHSRRASGTAAARARASSPSHRCPHTRWSSWPSGSWIRSIAGSWPCASGGEGAEPWPLSRRR